jgi:hypothetical protein
MKSNFLRQSFLKSFHRYKITFCLIGIFLSISNLLSGQATGDPKEDFLYGEFYVSQGLYREALPFYLSTIATDSNNCNLNYRIGLCYSKILGEQEFALPYLKKSVLDVDPKYMEGRYKSNGSPVESWLLLGDAFHRVNELTQASYAYHKYLELIGNSDEARVLMVKKKITGLGISYEFQRTEKRLKMVNMGSVINSRFSDYNPVLNGDQNILIYTQYWDSFDRIMICYKKDNTWSAPADITKQIGSEGDCYTSSLSFYGNELYLIRYGENNYDIYVSKFKDEKWDKMQPISGKINSKNQESSVCISADGNYLYFSSDRPGGEGGFDIYTAHREGNSWIDVKNLGKVINSKKNEEGPYISYDGTILYFSSDGHETIGNMDILYSELDDEGEWQQPQNIGSPINTTNDDLFYIYFKNTQTGFLSRDLPEGFGKNDIYMIVNENVKEMPFGSFQIENKIEAKLDTRTYSDDNTRKGTDSTRKGYSYVLRRLPGPENTTQNLNSKDVNTGEGVLPVVPVALVTTTATAPGAEVKLQPENTQKVIGSTSGPPVQNISNMPEQKKNQVNNTGEILSTPDINSGIVPAASIVVAPVVTTETVNDGNSSLQQKNEIKKETYHAMPDNKNGNEATQYSVQNDEPAKADTIPIYTVQVLALKHAMRPFKAKLLSLNVSSGKDGFHRYTIGEFQGWSVAVSELERIRNKGFPDAFIRNINTISNYSKDRDVKKSGRK